MIRRPHRLRFRHPAQIVVTGFAAAIAIGTLLLVLPIARAGDGGASLPYWSGFGEAVIQALIQVGGFGIMTLASLLGLLVSRRMGLCSRLTAAAETKSVGLVVGELRRAEPKPKTRHRGGRAPESELLLSMHLDARAGLRVGAAALPLPAYDAKKAA